MRNSFKALFWMLVGGGLAHVVHYLIYTNFLAQMDTVFNTQFAVTFETMLPSLVSATKSAVVIVPALAAVVAVAAIAGLFIKYNRDEAARVQIDNAEKVYQEAAKELEFLKETANDLTVDYKKKTEALQAEYAVKEKEIALSSSQKELQLSDEIRRLETEQAEANRTISKLMSALKKTGKP